MYTADGFIVPNSQRSSVLDAQPIRSAACSSVQLFRARTATNLALFITSVPRYSHSPTHLAHISIQFSK